MSLDAAIASVGAPCILKTRRLGYDGKGQFRLRSADDAGAAWEALGAQAEKVGLILEAFVPFERDGRRFTLIDTDGVRRRARVDDDVEKASVAKTLQATT